DRVDRIAVDRVQTVVAGYQEEEGPGDINMPAGQLLTGDHNLVNIQVALHYKVKPEEVEKYFLQADRVDGALTRAAETAMAEWVAARNVDEVLLNAKTQLGPEVVRLTRDRIDSYDLGVQLLDARIAFVSPPYEVKDAFENVARVQTTIRTMINK